MNYKANDAYIAFKPEATQGTAVLPTIMLPLISEDLKTVVNHVADPRIKGIGWKSNQLNRGFRTHEGSVVVLGDPDTLGHFLNMTLKKGTTSGDADGYTHPFTVDTPKSYTIEVKKGDHVVRYFGAMIDELKLSFDNGNLLITANIKAMGQFSVAKLGVALTGTPVTEVVLGDEYDINPTRGLVAGDKLDVGGTECTVASLDTDGVTVVITSASPTATAGSTVKLKPQAVSFSNLQDPLYFGNLFAGFGADESEATTNATQALSTPLYDFTISIKNNLFSQNGSNRLDPVAIKPQVPEANLQCKQMFQNADNRNEWLSRTKKAITLKLYGKHIKSDFSTQELATFKFYNVGLLENGNPLNVGEYIFDEQNFEALYDNSDAKALTVDLVNRTAGTAY